MALQSSNRSGCLRAAFVFFILSAGPLWAEPSGSTPTATTAGNWILSAGGAVDFPHSNWSPAYRIGIGSRAELSAPLDADWTVGLGIGYFHYQGNDSSGPILIDELRILPMTRFYLTNSNVNPYLTGGAGLAVQFTAASGKIAGNLNPDGFLGAGLEIRLAAQEALYFESNYSLMMAAGTLEQDIEALGGLRCGF